MLLISKLNFSQEKTKEGKLKQIINDSINKTFVYYALLDFHEKVEDTLFLEKETFLYIDKNNGSLWFKKPGDAPFPIPKTHYNKLSEFIFDSFLADDKYGILKRIASMTNLINNAKIGIDIASHQSANKDIDWKKVKVDTTYAPIDFVIMRSTLGYNVNFDSKFEEHYNGALKEKWPIGLYHNFVLNKTKRPDFLVHAEEQAHKFIASFKNKKISIKPILDLENHEKYAIVEEHFTSEEIREAAKKFIEIVESNLHTDIIIYSYERFYNKHLLGHFDNNLVWIARYPHTPQFGERKIYPGSKQPFLGISYDFKTQSFNYTVKNQTIGWQYSEDGVVDGISNKVDMNIILNDDFDKWLIQK